jgi:glycosyltransferase involved in cell wall biosynthesis
VRYLFLHSGREWSGTARVFATAARGLARRGHSVTFVAEPDSTVEQVVSEVAASLERRVLDVEPLKFGGAWMGAARKIARLARQQAADVVLVNSDREHFIAAVAYRLGSRARVIRRIPAGQSMGRNRTGRAAARIAPTFYIFATEREAESGTVPRAASGHAVVPIGVAEVAQQSDADLAGDDVNVVCIHDASSRGRAAAATRTVAMLAPRHPGLHLVIIGDGIYDDDLKMQAASLGALHLITSLGDRADQIEVMRKAKLGWVVADSDTAVCGILDFMSIGIPVLAPEHSVAGDYVLHDITGILVPSDDAFMTAAVTAELLANDGMREAMGDAARSRVLRQGTEAAMIDGFERAAAAADGRH